MAMPGCWGQRGRPGEGRSRRGGLAVGRKRREARSGLGVAARAGVPRLHQEENPSPPSVLPGEKGSAGRLLQPPQPGLCQCPPLPQLCPLPCPPTAGARGCHNLPAGLLLPQPRRVLTDPAPHPPGCWRRHQLVSFLTTISCRHGGGCHPGNVILVMNSTTMSHPRHQPRPGTDPEPQP